MAVLFIGFCMAWEIASARAAVEWSGAVLCALAVGE